MGEGFRETQSKLRIFIFLAILLVFISDVYAAKEIDVFKKGYEYYLSYQPDKAIDEFKSFLREYPQSTSKDAVMFWLGKSYLQLQATEEAKKVFSDLKKQFPESPYIAYVNKEWDKMGKADSSADVLKASGSEKEKKTGYPGKKICTG